MVLPPSKAFQFLMNNPESNFLSPLRTQPLKKQRGGSTPSSFASIRSDGSNNTGIATSTSTNINNSSNMAEAAGDAIARRRAELRRLQAQRENRAVKRPEVTPPSALLLSNPSGREPPRVPSGTSQEVGPPPTMIPRPGEPVARHHSDLFPSVQKSPRSTKAAVPALARPGQQIPSIPSVTSQPSTRPPKAPLSGNVPPPPPVNRKLEFARAKSAPPARPPPPPPKALVTALKAKEAPPTIANTVTAATPTFSAPSTQRPDPLFPATLLLHSDTSPSIVTANASTEQSPEVVMSATIPPPIKEIMTPTPVKETDSKPPPTETKTPAPVQTPAVPTTTTRRERIKSLRDGLDQGNVNVEATMSRDTSATMHSETAARLEQTLKLTMEERQKALQKIIELEKALDVAREETIAAKQPIVPATPQPKELQKMLLISDTQGEQAALQWARAQVVGIPPLTNETYITSPRPRLLDTARTSIAARVAAPKPKLLGDDRDTNQEPADMVLLERQLIAHFREAATCVPFEYESDMATFFIRRPYGMKTEPELFESCSLLEHSQYSRKAHVSSTSSIEVAAIIKANQSQFLLSDVAAYRYQVNDDWKSVTNPDQHDRPLGTVTYIDNEGMERDYSLDQLVEEALLVREQYCRTVTSAALGFKDRPVPEQSMATAPDKPLTSSIAVDTADIPYPPATIEVPKIEVKQEPNKTKEITEEPASSSGDVFAIFIGMIINTIFRFLTWLLFGLPLAILKTTIVGSVAIIILSTIYLYLLEQHHNGQSISLLETTGYHSNSYTLGIM